MKPRLVRVDAPADREALDAGSRLVAEFERRRATLTAAIDRMRALRDEAAIHDVRVGSRRLAAALDLWRPLLRPRSRRKASRRLRALRRSLGRIREAEVAFAHLNGRLVQALPPVRMGAADLVARLGRLVVRGRRRAARATRARDTARILTPLRRTVRSIPERAAAVTSLDHDAHERLGTLASDARRLLHDAASRGDDASLHTARIAVKKWRYACKSCDAVGVAPSNVDAGELRALQQALGDHHDCAMLRDLLAGETGRLRRRGLDERAENLRPLIATLEAEGVAALAAFVAMVERLEETSPRPAGPPVGAL